MKKIQLTQGENTIVDDQDVGIVNKHKWHILRGRNTFYAVRNVQIAKITKSIYLHRLLLGLSRGDKQEVDHINHDGLDNRKKNLRIVDHRKNQWNTYPRADCLSKYKGISWDNQRKKWQARCMVNGHRYCLGRFDNEIDAAAIYNYFARICFGEYAHLNKVEER